MTVLLWLFFIVHFVTSLVLFIFAINVLVHAVRSRKFRNTAVSGGEPFDETPVVTI